MSSGLLTASYIAASILFILSLGGLSHPEKARRGNIYGIAGMAIAIIATIASDQVSNLGTIIVMMLIGGSAGVYVAAKVQMTQMPELVAILHSFVGLAAVLVALRQPVRPRFGCRGDILQPGGLLLESGDMLQLRIELLHVARHLAVESYDLDPRGRPRCQQMGQRGAGCRDQHQRD